MAPAMRATRCVSAACASVHARAPRPAAPAAPPASSQRQPQGSATPVRSRSAHEAPGTMRSPAPPVPDDEEHASIRRARSTPSLSPPADHEARGTPASPAPSRRRPCACGARRPCAHRRAAQRLPARRPGPDLGPACSSAGRATAPIAATPPPCGSSTSIRLADPGCLAWRAPLPCRDRGRPAQRRAGSPAPLRPPLRLACARRVIA